MAINVDDLFGMIKDHPGAATIADCYEYIKRFNYLWHVPYEKRTPLICEYSVSIDGNQIRYVPDDLLTEKLCKLAIINKPLSLQWVPTKYKSEQLCMAAIKQDGRALQYTPKDRITNKIIECSLSSGCNFLEFVPEELKTRDLCMACVKINPYEIQNTPENLRTADMYEIAANIINSDIIASFPEEFRTEENWRIAASNNMEGNVSILNNLPQRYTEIWLEMIKLSPRAYYYKDSPTEEMTTLHKLLWEV